MKLSIIALFSDGDKKHFKKWVENAEKNVKVEHELIAVDNTSDGSLEKIEGVKVVRGGADVGCFYGRRLGFESSCGDYIWLVDGDDDILSLTKFDYDTDFVCFNYLCVLKNEKGDKVCKDPYPISYKAEGNFYHWSWKAKCKNMVWNKFIKREILEKIYPGIPQFEMYTSEDTLLSLFVMMMSKSVYFENHAFYRYYKNVGYSEGDAFSDINSATRIFKGTKEGWACYNLITTEEERKASGIETELIMLNLCKYALNLTYRMQRILPEWIEWLKEYFSEDLIKFMITEQKEELDEYASKLNDFIK